MRKRLLVLVLMVASVGAQAEVFMCKKPTGETEFSDTPCRAGSTSEIVPDREHLTPQQQEAAQQKMRQDAAEANDLAAQRTAAQANEPDRPAAPAPAPAEVSDDDVVYGCNDGRRVNSNCAPTLNNGRARDRRLSGPRPTPR